MYEVPHVHYDSEKIQWTSVETSSIIIQCNEKTWGALYSSRKENDTEDIKLLCFALYKLLQNALWSDVLVRKGGYSIKVE